MQLTKPGAEIFVPDGKPVEEALARTTHMGIGTHQDDLEIMAFHGILQCFQSQENWFTGVTVTDGAGSPRADLYANYTDEMMRTVRRAEQKLTVGHDAMDREHESRATHEGGQRKVLPQRAYVALLRAGELPDDTEQGLQPHIEIGIAAIGAEAVADARRCVGLNALVADRDIEARCVFAVDS